MLVFFLLSHLAAIASPFLIVSLRPALVLLICASLLLLTVEPLVISPQLLIAGMIVFLLLLLVVEPLVFSLQLLIGGMFVSALLLLVEPRVSSPQLLVVDGMFDFWLPVEPRVSLQLLIDGMSAAACCHRLLLSSGRPLFFAAHELLQPDKQRSELAAR